MGFIMPIFQLVRNLPFKSLKIISNHGSKKHCPCLTISFRKESRLLSFFVLSFDINYVRGVVSFPKISSSGKFSVLSESFAKFLNKIMVDYMCSECFID